MVLLREACYRCIGEGYSHVAQYINFSTWYSSEIAGQLRGNLQLFVAGNSDIFASVLQVINLKMIINVIYYPFLSMFGYWVTACV